MQKHIILSTSLCTILLLSGCGSNSGETESSSSSTSQSINETSILLPDTDSTNVLQNASGETATTAPAAPSDITTRSIDGSVIVSWEDNSEDESGFKVLRNGTLVVETDPDVTAFQDTGLEEDTEYQYVVESFNNAGQTAASAVAKAKIVKGTVKIPVSPSALEITTTSDSAKLCWADVADNEDGYMVYRNGKLIATLPADATTYADCALVPNASLEYTVYAYNAAGKSEALCGSATTLDPDPSIAKPAMPTDFSVRYDETRGSVMITWTDNADNENQYHLYRNGVLICVGGKNLQDLENTWIKPDQEYTYVLKAVNGGGATATEAISIITPSAEEMPVVTDAPAPTSDVDATTEDGKIALTWANNADNNLGYKIYRNGLLIACITDPAQLSFVDTDVVDGEQYTYDIRAYNAATGELGTPSNEVLNITAGDPASKNIRPYAVPEVLDPTYKVEEIQEDENGVETTVTEDPTYALNETITFKGTGSYDLDGTITSYKWYASNGEYLGSGETIQRSFDTAGTKTVKLVVTDDKGGKHIEAVQVEVVNNKAPRCFIESLWGDKYYVGDPIPYDASRSQDDKGIATYEWSHTRPISTVEGTGAEITPEYIYDSEGTKQMYVKVTDTEGLSRTCGRWVRIWPGNDTRPVALPTLNETYDEDIIVYEGESITLDGTESYDKDENGASISKYTWYRASTKIGEGVTLEDTPPYRSYGWLYRLKVEDNEGDVDYSTNYYEERRVLKVVMKSAADAEKRPVAIPTLNGTFNTSYAQEIELSEGATVTLDGSESYDRPVGAAGTITEYKWYRRTGGSAWQEIGTGVTFTDTIPTTGDRKLYYYYLKVTDNDGDVDTSINSFTDGQGRRYLKVLVDPASSNVGNDTQRPTAVLKQNGDEGTVEVNNGDTVVFDGSESTDNVGVVRYVFEHKPYGGDYVVVSDGTSPTVNYTAVYPGNNTADYVKLTVYDAAGNSDIQIWRLKVLDSGSDTSSNNDTQRPVAALTVNGSTTTISVDSGTTVTLDASGSTDDTGVVKYTFAKNVSGTYVDFYTGANSTITDVATKDTRNYIYYKVTAEDAAGKTDIQTRRVNFN